MPPSTAALSEQWLDTGFHVDANLRLIVSGEGQVDLWPQGPGQYMTTPKGYTTAGKGSSHMAGSLVGRVGENGKIFFIGERYEGTPGEDGRLFADRAEPVEQLFDRFVPSENQQRLHGIDLTLIGKPDAT